MREAAGFFSLRRDAARRMAVQAGFPWPGGPPSHLLRLPDGYRKALFVLALCLLAGLPLPATSAQARTNVRQYRPAPAPFGVTEAAEVADPTLRARLTTISQAFYTRVTAKTAVRFRRHPRHRRLDLLLMPSPEYRDSVRADALARLQRAGADLTTSQFFVYADRNPATQFLFLAFYDAAAQTVRLLGIDFISSGKLRPGDDSFLTPTGVFENLPDNWGYRALGTKNSKGWRGLGAKGSRVWDFGFQQAPRQFPQGVYDSQMRLLMHATDPDHGEPRLGGPDSKGCVRISASANRFLDHHAILDRRYEPLATTPTDRASWLLRTDRESTPYSGSYLVVGDSAINNAAR